MYSYIVPLDINNETRLSFQIQPASDQQLQQAAGLLFALAYPGRLRILWLLAERGELAVGELAAKLNLDQSALSHQLRVLRHARLLATTRKGKHIYYRIADQHILHIIHDAIVHADEVREN